MVQLAQLPHASEIAAAAGGLATFSASAVAQAAVGVPIADIVAQAPFVGVVIWLVVYFQNQMGKAEERRDRALERIGAECHAHQAVVTESMAAAMNTNTAALNANAEALSRMRAELAALRAVHAVQGVQIVAPNVQGADGAGGSK